MPVETPSVAPGEDLISIEHLNHVYMPGTPLEHQSLFDISMNVTKGAAHGLVGSTGSGKSTLLQHLNALYLPQSGHIRIGPYSLNDPKLDVKAIRRYAGLVFQNPEIYFFEQYVGDEVSYGPRMLYGRENLRERVRQAMEIVGLDFEKFKDRVTYNLSGGEKRKVALAATLASQPSLLILDEPTAGLDPFSRRNLQSTLKDAQRQGVEMIISSHSMGDITELTHNMTLLADGRALGTGNTAEIFNNEALITAAGLGSTRSGAVGRGHAQKGMADSTLHGYNGTIFRVNPQGCWRGRMNEFDFLSRMPLGQYVPTGSVLHKLDPRIKIVVIIMLIIVISFSQSIIGVGIGLLFIVLLTLISKIDLKFAIRSLTASLPFLLLFAVIQVFFFSMISDQQILFSLWKLRVIGQRVDRRGYPAGPVCGINPAHHIGVLLHLHIRADTGTAKAFKSIELPED